MQQVLTACFYFFFFNDTATTEIYTLSLHDALPISPDACVASSATTNSATLANRSAGSLASARASACSTAAGADRESTRLNSSHDQISYAVFCLQKKKSAVHDPVYCRLSTTRSLNDS